MLKIENIFKTLRDSYDKYYTSEHSMFHTMAKKGFDKFKLVSSSDHFRYRWEKKEGDMKDVVVFKSPFYSYDKFIMREGQNRFFTSSNEEIKKLKDKSLTEGLSELYGLKENWEIDFLDFYVDKKGGGVLTRNL